MAETERYPMGEMKMMQTIDLIPHKRNSEFFDDIIGENWADFVESIKQNGIIEPIVVDQNNVIISGHQRLKAARELGLWEVPVVVKYFATEDDALRALLDTNVKQRGVLPNNAKLGRVFAELKRLNGIKEGRPSEKTVNNVHNLSVDEIAEKLGYDKRTLYNAEKWSKLPAEYQELIENGTITASAGARLIASMDGDEQAALFAKLRSFPQAHFTNDDIETFKKEVQEENTRRLQEMREDFKEQMEEKEADIRAEYEGTLAEQEQAIDRIKAEESKRYDNLKFLYDKLRTEYGEKVDKLIDLENKERERNEPTQKAYIALDNDGLFFKTRCTDFIKSLAPYRYVVARIRELNPKRQLEITQSIKEVRDLMDSLIYVGTKGDSDERGYERID